LQLGPERFRAPEILFTPELIGEEASGVHQVVVDSINRADLDLRKNLFANIVLSGGSTLCKGYGDRLLNEVKRLALKDIKVSRVGICDSRLTVALLTDQDIRTTGAQVLDLDRWLHSSRT
jgi:actin-related protein